ncbi:MAG: glycosyltransferase family 2 protein, partial [Rhodothermales bacterium]|nr:glycosyltransferase family 2 protein [Rhodothermales bacterium]
MRQPFTHADTVTTTSASPAPDSGLQNPSEGIDVTVIIVNYNVREFLQQAVASVYRAKGALRVEVIVVDNNSVDGSADSIRANYPDARLIQNTDNIGFGKANNQAIRASSGQYLLILNPDTIIQEDTLQTLVDFMRTHPDAGAVG